MKISSWKKRIDEAANAEANTQKRVQSILSIVKPNQLQARSIETTNAPQEVQKTLAEITTPVRMERSPKSTIDDRHIKLTIQHAMQRLIWNKAANCQSISN
jgi:hypothetical protein